jgi:hypothetical protein
MTNLPKTVGAFYDDAMGALDGVALAKKIASGELSAKEVIDAALQRI